MDAAAPLVLIENLDALGEPDYSDADDSTDNDLLSSEEKEVIGTGLFGDNSDSSANVSAASGTNGMPSSDNDTLCKSL